MTKTMNILKLLRTFYEKAMNDSRLAPCHITLYLGIFQHWTSQQFRSPMSVMRKEIMRLSKVNAKATYYKISRELHDFGHIEYFPAANKSETSQVKLK
jgi:hypothetical protein